jgi:CheY-like chemotaxis protein
MSALKFLQNHRPDLFILDIDMPGMDGYELARKIREANQNAPILFLTGNAKKEYVFEAIRVGASDFILKPIDREIVLKRIGKFI